jgi:hypothetical protein
MQQSHYREYKHHHWYYEKACVVYALRIENISHWRTHFLKVSYGNKMNFFFAILVEIKGYKR